MYVLNGEGRNWSFLEPVYILVQESSLQAESSKLLLLYDKSQNLGFIETEEKLLFLFLLKNSNIKLNLVIQPNSP